MYAVQLFLYADKVTNTLLRLLLLRTLIQTGGSGRFVLPFPPRDLKTLLVKVISSHLLHMLIFTCSPARSMFPGAHSRLAQAVLFSMTTKRTVSCYFLQFCCQQKLIQIGCVATNLDCLPLQWPAYAQYLDEAGVNWRSFQNSYNWATNSGLFYFEAFQQAAVNSSLYQRGLAFDGDNGIPAFKAAAAAGTLPEVSWVFPPGALQEHPPNTPVDASWFMNEIVSAAINGPNYNETIILINYDGKWK